MITLWYHLGNVFLYNVDDWFLLRKDYRIIGELVGNSNFIPTLPLKLLPEEAVLLKEKGVVKVFEVDGNIISKYEKACDNDITFETELLEKQRQLYRDNRKRQLLDYKGDIISAKRKRGDHRSEEEILEEELKKSCQVTKENMIWPILLEPFQENGSDLNEVDISEIKKHTSELKCFVYKDMWEKGYYVTLGHKFGGDYLAYSGDPISYHAVFIIRCVENVEMQIHTTEIVAFGRLGTSVKKRAVLASLDENKSVSYITLNWLEGS